LTLGPGWEYAPGLKVVPQTPRGAKSFSPGSGDEPRPLDLYEPGPLVLYESGPMGTVRCSVYRATWPGFGSRPRTWPGSKVHDQRPFFH
jgi:hypothetical protein